LTGKNILFVSWQGGLGHVTRDLAIVKELRKQNPKVKVQWLAHPLASKLIEDAGETLLPESRLSADYNEAAAQAIIGFKLNLMKFVKLSNKMFKHNAGLFFREVASKYDFDLVVGDESFEIVMALSDLNFKLKCPMIMIEDFIAMASLSNNPLEKIGAHRLNRRKVNRMSRSSDSGITYAYVGKAEDIPNKNFGFLLPNQREFARQHYHFLGYIVRFDPAEYADKARIRTKLGYGNEPLVVCATGGTSAGMEMLEKCGKAYILLKKEIPNLRMLCVCGELYGRKPPELPPEVEVQSLIPNLYEHYAACDMAVVVGGMTTTIELTVLRRPFVYFPLENQFDQQLYVTSRLTRLGAGIKMTYFRTTPEALAQTIKANIGKEVDWEPIRTDGAAKGAELIESLIQKIN
jgi:UDP-N-acetylglucosamine:LPS N-acetylglucosamine transferase